MTHAHSHWTEEQNDILRQCYLEEGASERLQTALGRSAKALTAHAQAMGLVKRCPRWTTEDDDTLRRHYGKATKETLLAMFGRTWTGIVHRAMRLGLTDPHLWTPEEDKVLYDWYPDGRWKLIYQRLPGRNRNAISNRVALLGISMTTQAKHRLHQQGQRVRGHRVFDSCGKVLGAVVSHALAGAQSRKLSHTVLDGSPENMQYLDSIAHDVCPLSGRPLTYRTKARQTTATASLDRIDSTKGYDRGNVQWIHKAVNQVKMALPEDAFIQICCDVARHRGELK